MIIKVFLLTAAFYTRVYTQNSIYSIAVWGIGILLFSLIFHGFELEVLLWAFLSFLMAAGYFAFLDYIEDKTLWWGFAFLGGAVLILFG